MMLADDRCSVLTFLGSNRSLLWPHQNRNSVSQYDSD
jgi:hypothetical protein